MSQLTIGILSPFRRFPAAVIASVALAGISADAYSAAKSPKVTSAQVIRSLDAVIQPRFQTDAGMFGEERVVNEIVTGHRQVDLSDVMTDEKDTERTSLNRIAKAPYFVIVGIMHVRHKPGSHKGIHDAAKLAKQFKASTTPIEASGTSYKRAMRSFGWAEAHMNDATMEAYGKVKSGQPVDSTYGKFTVAIRPIKAERKACTSCHVGAHIGDTLGAMVYMVAPTHPAQPSTAVAYSDKDSGAG